MLWPAASMAVARERPAKADSVPKLAMRFARWKSVMAGCWLLPAVESWDSGLRGLGFLVRRRLLKGCSLQSYASSTGRHGSTRRQDVLGRVDVPVIFGGAFRAQPVPNCLSRFRELALHIVKHLRNRQPNIYTMQTTP